MDRSGFADEGPQLPFLTTPHDNFRQGLPLLKEDARLGHPVEVIQAQARGTSDLRPKSFFALFTNSWDLAMVTGDCLCETRAEA